MTVDRDALFAGSTLLVETPEAAPLLGLARSCLASAFDVDDPRLAERVLTPDDWFQRVGRARAAFAASEWLPAVRAMLPSLGFDPATTALDRPRLRAVHSGMHRIAAAAPAFFAHRDTWYANPSQQVNVWCPLFPVVPAETFELFPEVFARAVANDSECFDLLQFERDAGFQGAPSGPGAIYPRALHSAEWGRAADVAPAVGSVFVFSGAHLHRTLSHDLGHTRFSLDFRCVDLRDVASGRGAPNVDDRSRGSTLEAAVRPA